MSAENFGLGYLPYCFLKVLKDLRTPGADSCTLNYEVENWNL